MPPPPYLTHLFPSTPVHALSFQPFTDVLTVGHSRGISSLLVPGSGEANFDSLEADPFESKRRRREREVQGLLDKVPMDLITLDQDVVGRVDRDVLRRGDKKDVLGGGAASFAKMTRAERLKVQGKAALEEDEELSEGEDEDDEDDELRRRREKAEKRIEKADAKNRMRGKSSGLKKALRKRRRNVIDPQTVRLARPARPLAAISRLADSICFPPARTGRAQGKARAAARAQQAGQGKQGRQGSRTVGPGRRARAVQVCVDSAQPVPSSLASRSTAPPHRPFRFVVMIQAGVPVSLSLRCRISLARETTLGLLVPSHAIPAPSPLLPLAILSVP